MFIAATVNAQLATDAVRRAIQAGNAGVAAPGAITAVSAISADGEGRGGAQLLQRLAGRVLPAVVLARLDDSQGIVDIAGERYSVAARLPDNGQAVMLRFAAGAIGGSVAAGVTGASIAIAAATAAAPERAAQVMLGSLAQRLSEVASGEPRPLTLGPVAASVQSAPAFAAALQALVRDSGLFYESHVARWSRGQYPLTQLQQEPQAVGVSVAGGSAAANMMPGHDSTARAAAAAPAQSALLASELQPIVREQLDMLEHRGLSVTLEAWPGQPLLLEIRRRLEDERRPPGAPAAAAEDAPWATRLALELPQLGKLEAQIGLAGDRLQLVLHAAAAVAPQLGAHAGHLSEALAGAGIRLSGLRIQP